MVNLVLIKRLVKEYCEENYINFYLYISSILTEFPFSPTSVILSADNRATKKRSKVVHKRFRV